jgi:hypothetical protein
MPQINTCVRRARLTSVGRGVRDRYRTSIRGLPSPGELASQQQRAPRRMGTLRMIIISLQLQQTSAINGFPCLLLED